MRHLPNQAFSKVSIQKTLEDLFKDRIVIVIAFAISAGIAYFRPEPQALVSNRDFIRVRKLLKRTTRSLISKMQILPESMRSQ